MAKEIPMFNHQAGLALVPDSATHGCITPTLSVPLGLYESDLAATRADWEIDEN